MNLRTSTFKASINVILNLSVLSFCDELTTAPPHALMSSVVAVFSFLIPSSEIYPRFLNAASNSDFASSGNAVFNGATNTAPPTLGFAVVTFVTSFLFSAITILL